MSNERLVESMVRRMRTDGLMNFVGIDIGGAHIKIATTGGDARQIPLPIWRDKQNLEVVLREIETTLAGPCCVGVTMTAELADCFQSKREGVEYIVAAVSRSFPQQSPLFYQLDGGMCSPAVATERWESVAASNWHALAWYAFHDFQSDSGFLLDIGSTTCDTIPVTSGMPVVANQNDFDRLVNRQLFYAGIGRTPVCTVLDRVRFGSGTVTIARELFATMADVFLWLEQVTPDPNSTDTADGRPATRALAGQRLARMLCADYQSGTEALVEAIAVQAKQALMQHLSESLQTVIAHYPSVPRLFRITGSGVWLAREVIASTFGSDGVKGDPVIHPLADTHVQNQTATALAVAVKREQVFRIERTSPDE